MHTRVVKRDTKKIGTVSELMVMAALMRAGYRLAIPYGENCRYDVIIEGADGSLARVQVKTGRLRGGVILFNTYSSHWHRGGTSTRLYMGEVDFFGVFCPQSGQSFLVPVSHVAASGTLRVDQPKNRQLRKIRWAGDYELER